MRSYLSYRAKRELLIQIAPRYREASSALKEVILDEFVAATGYARKYAIRLLNHPGDLKLNITRPRPPRYGAEVQHAFQLAWTAANHICAMRFTLGVNGAKPPVDHLCQATQAQASMTTCWPAPGLWIHGPNRPTCQDSDRL